MIYLDNAATTMRKPQEVVDAVVAAMGSLGNAGRGASAGALDAGRMVLRCREAMAHLLGCPRADHVCFSANSTCALNAAISGLVGPGDRVVTTVLEHNSVLRPLARLADERGAEVAYAGCDAHGFLDMDDLERLATPGTRLVAVTHGSNVTGNLVDVARVAELAHAVGALVVVDASQTAGAVPLDMASMGLDVVCFTGHKGLMGPQGTGGMAVAEGVEPRPWAEGGSGVHSFDRRHPLGWPTRMEAGTLNAHGLAGLLAAVRCIEEGGGPAAVGAREHELAQRLYEGVAGVPGVTVYRRMARGARALRVDRGAERGRPGLGRGCRRARFRLGDRLPRRRSLRAAHAPRAGDGAQGCRAPELRLVQYGGGGRHRRGRHPRNRLGMSQKLSQK